MQFTGTLAQSSSREQDFQFVIMSLKMYEKMTIPPLFIMNPTCDFWWEKKWKVYSIKLKPASMKYWGGVDIKWL